ncbi:MAG: RNA-binding S4 domain-containing protein [Akkermansiaceae bacterium]
MKVAQAGIVDNDRLAGQMRTDKWLWAVRLYKTRSLAAHDCAAGKVKRGGKNLKASTALKIGDLLEVPSHDGSYKRTVEIVALLEKRVKGSLAAEAVIDHTPAEVLAQAEERRLAHRENRTRRKEGDQGRLTKKNRRNWEKNRYF